jgi:hypothetical protein
MSSIYRKGRDGYYYYQAYVYNPESKKKDKRIFHSLSTKNLLEAETKQNELDTQYEKQNHIDSNSSRLSYNFSPKPTIAIIVGTIAITILVFDFFRPNTVKQENSGSIIPEKVEGVAKKFEVTPKNIEPVKLVINEQIDPIKENKPEIINTTPEPKQVAPKVTIPKYTVERVDRLSGAFEQGKVYVTINKNSSNESQRLLCDDLTKRFSEFSNIVICLYANNRAGKDLARGNDETVSVEEQKLSWLAMYTYNSVEGEYFDDNPSGYLGIY